MADGRPVALVTGASYGVGAATALALAGAGFDLALTATSTGNLAGTLAALAPSGRRAVAVGLDLRSQNSIEAAVAEVLDGLGRVEVLVNNAGANLRSDALDTTRGEWDALMSANVTGTFFLTQQVGRHMVARRGGGRIVSIASTHALVGATGRSAYGMGKAALLAMTRMLAVEWAGHGITVNAVAPGRLDTASPSRAGTGGSGEYMAAMLRRIPLHRLATAEEVAGAVAFLAGPLAGSVTGQTIVVDGGLTAA